MGARRGLACASKIVVVLMAKLPLAQGKRELCCFTDARQSERFFAHKAHILFFVLVVIVLDVVEAVVAQVVLDFAGVAIGGVLVRSKGDQHL